MNKTTVLKLYSRLRARCYLAAAVSLASSTLALQAALPTPLVELRFSEGSGASSANSGSLSGSASFVVDNEMPRFTNNVPTGTYAPGGNTSSLDFGIIAAGQGGRAVDLAAGSGDGTLGALNAFTISGWLNARNLSEGFGGNRIAFALASPNGPGFDLVQLANGALRIGINQWPDGANGGGPRSSTGKIKADPQASSTNWIFFSVTYDPTLPSGNLKYYFGNSSALASLDSSHNYKGGIDNGGVIESTGFLTVGNFSDVVGARNEVGPGGGSRVFRGLVDELRIYDTALSLAQVQEAQLNGALPSVPVTITSSTTQRTVFTGQSASFEVQVSGSAPIAYQWQRNGIDIPGATNSTYTVSQTAAGDNGAAFRVRVSNAANTGGVFSEPATLTVLEENNHKVFLSFSEGGTSVTNLGNLGGRGVYAVREGFPVVSANVPAGQFAPTNNTSSIDFGTIAASEGGRAVDLTNRFDITLGPITAFTITGWLNARDLAEGFGGNRVAFALATPGGAGFDLVQVASGALRLGVNQWPDAGAGGPLSSEGKITADPSAGAENWVFFAVTYDSALPTGNVAYYFGKPNEAAQADLTSDYNQGTIEQTGPLTIGNFSAVAGARNETGPAGGSRVFRGLIDEVNVFNKALTLTEIQAVQKAPAYKPAVSEPATIPALEPADQTVFAGNNVTFSVNALGALPLGYQWWNSRNGRDAAILDATGTSLTLTNVSLAENGTQFWVVVTNQAGNVTSRRATLTVLAENNKKVSLPFSEGRGTNTANHGNVGGTANFVQVGGYPVFTNLVPAGPFAPQGNSNSVDFGVIAEDEGGRAIDLTTQITPTIGPMRSFTITGWLNSRDLRHGFGGNRIVYSQTNPGQGGFDLVQEAGGVLWLGVNQWPDAQPNSPAKSVRTLTEDPEAGANNWVFFAVTYDGTSAAANTSFYFGSPTEAAALDNTVDYDQGPITAVGPLTIGNFSTVDAGARGGTGNAGGSRAFRGLMDEINVYNRVLTLAEIQEVQKAAVVVPTESPAISASVQNNQIVITWNASGNFQLQSRSDLGAGGSWADESTAPVANGSERTVRLPISGGVRFFRLVQR